VLNDGYELLRFRPERVKARFAGCAITAGDMVRRAGAFLYAAGTTTGQRGAVSLVRANCGAA